MKRLRWTCRLSLGAGVLGCFLGVPLGTLVGTLYGMVLGDVSIGLDGGLLGGGLLGLTGVLYGLVLGLREKEPEPSLVEDRSSERKVRSEPTPRELSLAGLVPGEASPGY
jgi:hypothetical protein